MRDCSNVEMRERLPELLHGVLRAEVAAEVRAHLTQCSACRAELELLERVRSVLATPSTSADTARIVARLPRYQRLSVWQRATRSPQLRAAAAVLLMVGGGYAIIRSAPSTDRTPDTVAVAPAGAAELAIGDTFQDLTDSDLRAMLDEIAEIQAVTPDATEEEMPVIQRNGSGSGGEESEG